MGEYSLGWVRSLGQSVIGKQPRKQWFYVNTKGTHYLIIHQNV